MFNYETHLTVVFLFALHACAHSKNANFEFSGAKARLTHKRRIGLTIARELISK